MRFSSLVAAALLSLSPNSALAGRRDYDTHDYYAVHLDARTSPQELASHLGLEYDGTLGAMTDHHIFKARRHDHDILADAMSSHKLRKRSLELGYENSILDSVRLNQKQKLTKRLEKRGPMPPLDPRQAPTDNSPTKGDLSPLEQSKFEVAKDLDIKDPIFHAQWHHLNYESPGNDLNVTGVWKQGITGKNKTVCIVDDGLDKDSPDIRANYFGAGSYDYNDKADDPIPRLSDDTHGTRCAGEIAAVRNDVCGVGVAYNSKVSGIRILSKAISDADEAEAMIYHFQENDIYSCSWGPPDDGRQMGRPGILIRRAMQTGINDGRGGLGTVYVFAAGNGAARDDNCNFDGYTNSIYSITVGAVDHLGRHPYYAEKCSANLVVTYSSGSQDAIHTSTIGGQCVTSHGGTSAAGPLAAGVYALVLEARPDLSWRDLQWLSVENAIPFKSESDTGDLSSYDWQNTTIGKQYSHQYGYGKVDAYRFVEAAKTFKKRKPQAWYKSPWQHIRHAIPEGEEGLSSHFKVTKDVLKEANLERLEQVTVTMNVEHTRRGDLMVDLISPSGIVSHIATARMNDDHVGGYVDWTFMSVAHWGESGEGDWTIIIKDVKIGNGHNGTFTDWKLNLFGEAIDASKATKIPLEEEGDDANHDKETGVASTVSVSLPAATGSLPEHPSDHPERPVNVRPSDTSAAASSVTATTGFTKPVATGTTEEEVTKPSASPQAQESSKNDSFLPSPFPTFGVSKRTQVWIYGALVLIVLFCIGLAAFFFIVRRRQQRRLDREAYEFDRLDDSDDEGGAMNRAGGAGGRGKRRAGELYDAFAGESDEDLFSDDEAYRDEEGHEAEDEEGDEKTGLSESSGSGSGAAARP